MRGTLKINKASRIILFGISIFLPTVFCSSGWEEDAIKLAKEIPSYPDSSYVGEFITSYPSSLPGAGIIYHSTAAKDDVLEFYLEHLPDEKWEVTKVNADKTENSVPYIIESQKDNWLCQVIIENKEQTRITINIVTK